MGSPRHHRPPKEGSVRPKIRRAGIIVLALTALYYIVSLNVLIHNLEGDVRDSLKAQRIAEEARSEDAERFQSQITALQEQLTAAQEDLAAARADVDALRKQLERMGVEPDVPIEPSAGQGGDPGTSQSGSSSDPTAPASGSSADSPPAQAEPSSPTPAPQPADPADPPDDRKEGLLTDDPIICINHLCI